MYFLFICQCLLGSSPVNNTQNNNLLFISWLDSSNAHRYDSWGAAHDDDDDDDDDTQQASITTFFPIFVVNHSTFYSFVRINKLHLDD